MLWASGQERPVRDQQVREHGDAPGEERRVLAGGKAVRIPLPRTALERLGGAVERRGDDMGVPATTEGGVSGSWAKEAGS